MLSNPNGDAAPELQGTIGLDWPDRLTTASKELRRLSLHSEAAVAHAAAVELRRLEDTDWTERAREAQSEYHRCFGDWLLGDQEDAPTIAAIDREFGPPTIRAIARLACEARMNGAATEDKRAPTTMPPGMRLLTMAECHDEVMASIACISGAENRARTAAWKERAADLKRRAELHAAAAKDRAAVAVSAREATERMIAADFTGAAGKLTLRGRRGAPNQFWMKRHGMWVKHDLAGAIQLHGGLPYGVEVADIVAAALDILDEREAA
ncbi:MAG: hypothetical protein ABUL55_02765 [Pseudomonadota bacterium]